MLRHLSLALLATLAVMTLGPDDALAHHRYHWYQAAWYGSDLSSSDPRAGRAGFPNRYYGRMCYRAASGRAICPVLYR
jgi:hypothetical protein